MIRWMIAYLVGTIEAGGYHLIDYIHQVLGFANHMIDLYESGRFADCRFFDCELKCLHIRWHFVQVVE